MVVGILAPGELPIPAVRGGAIEMLVTQLLDVNERKQEHVFHVFSIHDDKADEESVKYKKTVFHYYTPNKLDVCCSFLWRVVYRISARSIPYKSPFMKFVREELCRIETDLIIAEGNYLQILELPERNNLVLHIHTDILNDAVPLAQKVIKKCCKIAVISKYIQDRVDAAAPAYKKTVVLKNGIDTGRFAELDEKSDLKYKLGIFPGKKLFIYCGRIVPIKGVMEMLQAFELANMEDTTLLIVGSTGFQGTPVGEYERSVIRYAREKKLDVVFAGYVAHDNLPEYYSIADYAICPSTCNEAAGLVVIEAISSGVPVVASNKGGIPEYMDEKSGILVKCDANFIKNLSIAFHEMPIIFKKGIDTEYLTEYRKCYSLERYYENFTLLLEESIQAVKNGRY